MHVLHNSPQLAPSHVFRYFHHIYSTEKRKYIVEWARELQLSGFSLPGKPGLICVEGAKADVQEYLARVKRLPWQRMQSRVSSVELCCVYVCICVLMCSFLKRTKKINPTFSLQQRHNTWRNVLTLTHCGNLTLSTNCAYL